jgi:N-methylhydantoinase A
VREEYPECFATTSSSVSPQFREFERFTTTAMNAFVGPKVRNYVTRLETEIGASGFKADLRIMASNGGVATPSMVAERPVLTLLSGPAAGVIGGDWAGGLSGRRNLITFDIGGTSADIGIVTQGGFGEATARDTWIAGFPVLVPMIDVHTIGAGGGSIASVDASGMLRVGPESAGAVPGPICYARGGTRPTITDANVVLGRLDPDRLLAVDRGVSLATIEAALREHVGAALGLDATEAALAIVRVANDRMAGAIRMVSLARGHDPRDFALFAFGGAGPLHAAALARELGIPKVLIPARPGLTNALGCLVADLRHDFVATVNQPLEALAPGRVGEVFTAQIASGRALLERENVATLRIETLHRADMQFQGQSHILPVAIASTAITVEALRAAFAAAYWKRFGVELPEIRPVLVNLHTAVIGVRPEISLAALAGTDHVATLKEAQLGERLVWFSDGWRQTPIYAREKLPFDATFEGPAILEQLDCTTVIEPGDKVVQDKLGNLLVSVK